MTTSARRSQVTRGSTRESDNQPFGQAAEPHKRFEPQSVRSLQPGTQARPKALRMYTEDEISEILQVSRSQLRKWRMARNRRAGVGPPFKKIGRLVRYPEQELQDYINGK